MANQVMPTFDLGGMSMLMQWAPQIKAIIDASTSNAEIGDKIKAIAPPLVDILTNVATVLYPGLAPALKIAAGALSVFDPNGIKWLQAALNKFLDPSPNLEVDGIVGPATIAAITQAQQQLGVDPDGFAGKITMAAIASALAKMKK